MKLKLRLKNYTLRRLQPKNGEFTVWEIVTPDEKFRIGVVRQISDPYLYKKIGWQEFRVRFWLGTKFYKQEHFVGRTRDSVIRQMLEI